MLEGEKDGLKSFVNFNHIVRIDSEIRLDNAQGDRSLKADELSILKECDVVILNLWAIDFLGGRTRIYSHTAAYESNWNRARRWLRDIGLL